jgi:hypothetical protein
MTVAIAQDGHERAFRQNIAETARYLQEVLGQSLTALIADVRNAKALGKCQIPDSDQSS